MTDPILHITSRTSWADAQKVGVYSADTLVGQGFIHCSKAGQVLRVANAVFASQRGLVILAVDPARLKSEVRWEPGTDKADELFPHVYGPINLEAVIQAVDFEPGADGRFTLPDSLTR